MYSGEADILQFLRTSVQRSTCAAALIQKYLTALITRRLAVCREGERTRGFYPPGAEGHELQYPAAAPEGSVPPMRCCNKQDIPWPAAAAFSPFARRRTCAESCPAALGQTASAQREELHQPDAAGGHYHQPSYVRDGRCQPQRRSERPASAWCARGGPTPFEGCSVKAWL